MEWAGRGEAGRGSPGQWEEIGAPEPAHCCGWPDAHSFGGSPNIQNSQITSRVHQEYQVSAGEFESLCGEHPGEESSRKNLMLNTPPAVIEKQTSLSKGAASGSFSVCVFFFRQQTLRNVINEKKNNKRHLGDPIYACKSITQEVEAGESLQISSQHWLRNEILFPKHKMCLS